MESTANRAKARSEPARAPRRLIGLERQYRCGACNHEQRSWDRMRNCTACGEALAMAVIRRAALA
jgi:transcription elongation factor Elf1